VTRDDLTMLAVAVVLLAAGALAWLLYLRSPLPGDPATLSGLPYTLGSWRGTDIPLEETVESMLRADHNVQRAYAHPLGDVIWLYVGYYGTRRGGSPEHTPATCYAANGWEVRKSRTLSVAGAPGLRVREYVVEDAGAQRLVHFWYRTYRSTGLLSRWSLGWDHLVGRLVAGRADGALVRLSTPMPPGELHAARARLLALDRRVEAALEEHWPREGSTALPRREPSHVAFRPVPR